MPTLADLTEYRDATADLSLAAELELQDLFNTLSGQSPEVIRDTLLRVAPVLTAQYGQAAAAVAADWYEANGVGRASVAKPVKTSEVTERVRYRAGHLWTPTAAVTLTSLMMDADEFIKRPARATIRESAFRNRQRWVRVPQGAKTCAFCLMLASRSAEWMYLTRQSAGDQGKGVGDRYHGKCDCAVVMASEPADVPWDPDPFFAIYRTATEVTGSRSDTTAILKFIRREFPDAVTDSVDDPLHD